VGTYTERVLMAYADALFDSADDVCSKKKEAYEIMEMIRQANSRRFWSIRGIAGKLCSLNVSIIENE
jgi:hypothetical protein